MDEQFRAVLLRLASPASEQENYLRRLGTVPSADELALELNDALGVVLHELDAAARSAAVRLDGYLTAISGSDDAELWSIAARTQRQNGSTFASLQRPSCSLSRQR